MDKTMIGKYLYIYWRTEAEHSLISQEQFNNLIYEFEKTRTKIEFCGKRSSYSSGDTYSKITKGKYVKIFYCENGKFYVKATNWFDDSKNRERDDIGHRGSSYLGQRFKELNNKSLKVAFGYTPEDFLICMPKIFIYQDSTQRDKEIISSGVDFSSAWPACARGVLPTYNGYLELEGTVKPNKDYPFAFYLNSGHSAEYGVYDTHDWLDYVRCQQSLFRVGKKEKGIIQSPFLDPSKDRTILMKKSSYEMTEIFNDFYNFRTLSDKEDKWVNPSESMQKLKEYCSNNIDIFHKKAKGLSVASIGFMHKNPYNRFKLAHIAVVIQARAVSNTLKVIDKVKMRNVLYACVDGVIYKGSDRIAQDEKQFGVLRQEFIGKKIMFKNTSTYTIMNDDGTCFKCNHGSCNYYDDGRPIIEEDIKGFDDMYHFVQKKGVDIDD